MPSTERSTGGRAALRHLTGVLGLAVAVAVLALIGATPAQAAGPVVPPTCIRAIMPDHARGNCVAPEGVHSAASWDEVRGTTRATMPLTVDADGIAHGSYRLPLGFARIRLYDRFAGPTTPRYVWPFDGTLNCNHWVSGPVAGLDFTGTINMIGGTYPCGLSTGSTGAMLQLAIPANQLTGDRYLIIYVNVRTETGTDVYAGRQIVLRLPKQAHAVPTASCTVSPVAGRPGVVRFTSTSTDPTGIEPLVTWTFADGETRTGPVVQRRFTTPGTHSAVMSVVGAEDSAVGSCTTQVDPPKLRASINYDPASPSQEDAPIDATVRVSASPDGVGTVTAIRATGSGSDVLRATGSGVSFVVDPPSGGDHTNFALEPGEHAEFEVQLHPDGIGRYTLASNFSGTVQRTGAAPLTVTAAAQAKGEVGQALDVEITFDPPEVERQEESQTEPEPVELEATVKVTNRSGAEMHDVRLFDLETSPVSPVADLADFQANLVRTAPEGAIPAAGLLVDADGVLADDASAELVTTWTATDDTEARFRAVVIGKRPDQSEDLGSDREVWRLGPKYRLGITGEARTPGTSAGELLPAGQAYVYDGEVVNLSRTERLRVGPLFPELRGALNATSFAWDTSAVDDGEYATAGPIELAPGERRSFRVRVATSWSDPVDADVVPSATGGTRGELRFTPWAERIDAERVDPDEPVLVDMATELRAEDGVVEQTIHIDDSIEIPEKSPAAIAGGLMYSGGVGVKNAAGAILMAPTELGVMAYGFLKATWETQDRIWAEMTEAERDRFAGDVAALSAEIAMRNWEFASKAPGEIYAQAHAMTLAKMTELDNAWQVGDWTQAEQVYVSASTDALAQIVLPIAAAKIARSAAGVRALKRLQASLQTHFETAVSWRLGTVSRIEQVGPLLDEIRSGTELLPEHLPKLYGISPEEFAELQRIGTKYNALLTMRSRHASSLAWIDRGAMLKPEALKLKTVSDLDVHLGYDAEDIGSLVLRKPTPLAEFEAALATNPNANLDGFIDAFIDAKRPAAFDGNVGLWDVNARKRLEQRITEWKELERPYKQWSRLGSEEGAGFIETTLDYGVNAIDSTVRPVAKGQGKYVGFRMVRDTTVPAGEEAYLLQLFDAKKGKWARVTGDIDPIAFTNPDGSALSMAIHADLLDDLVRSPIVRALHGETATWLGGKPGNQGLGNVAGQFKQVNGVFEAALQIAPGTSLPRVVRLDPGNSYWNSPFDYNLHWEGGFIFSGTYIPRGARPIPTPDWGAVGAAAYAGPVSRTVESLPISIGNAPVIGRCAVLLSNAANAEPLVLDADYTIKQVTGLAVGGVKDLVKTGYTGYCLTEGPTVPLHVKITAGVVSGAAAGSTRIEVPDSMTSRNGSATGFQVGDRILIGAGTPQAEENVVVGFGSIVLQTPLRYSHPAGTSIIVIERAAPQVGPPPSGGDPTGTKPDVSPPAAKPVKPRVRLRARLAGRAVVGQRVTCAGGTFTGTAPIRRATTWQRQVGRRWITIPRATKATLVLTRANAGRRVRCVVRASNRAGAATATSAPVLVRAARSVRPPR